MAASALVNVWIEAPPPGALPGVALGSQTLLVAERAVAFFAIWLLVLVVAGQALAGRLPVEISGRGVRYADAETTHASVAETERSMWRLEGAQELGIELEAAVPVILKVLRERGTPQSVELDRSLDRLAALAERI